MVRNEGKVSMFFPMFVRKQDNGDTRRGGKSKDLLSKKSAAMRVSSAYSGSISK